MGKRKRMNRRERRDMVARISNNEWPMKCHYCRKKMHKHQATLDHLTPVSRGGRNNIYNLVLACAKCNNDKGSLCYGEYIEQLRSQQHRKNDGDSRPPSDGR